MDTNISFPRKNAVEVTVAGVMATWCYDKEAASGCCSPAVASSLYRSVTYSFGSICLGSLLQGIMQALRKIIPQRSRANSNDQCCGLCFCVLECFGRVVEDSLDYFNQWAYVFIGIYGYGYVESGQKVLELFVSKGWMSIISERLASYVTGCITLAVGIATGLSVWVTTVLVDTLNAGNQTDDSGHFVYGPVPQHVSFL
jgi:Plasma-membrane choline transporter